MRTAITENLTLKIISVVIGLITYLFVMQERAATRDIRYSVAVEPPDGYILLSDVPDLHLAIAGRSRHLARLDEGFEVNLRFSRPVTHKVFEPADFSLPSGVEIRTITPQVVTLNFSRLITREVPIMVNPSGEPASGYSITAMSVNPPSIQVEGPEDPMNNLVGIFTQAINVSGWNETTTRHVNLVPPGGFISYDTSLSIWVTIEIEQDEGILPISGVPVILSGPQDRFSVEQQTVTVILRGPRTVIERLDPTNFSASVDATPYLEHPSGVYDVAPRIINLPHDTQVIGVTPDTLRLVVESSSSYGYYPIPMFNLFPFPLPPVVVTPPAATESPLEQSNSEG